MSDEPRRPKPNYDIGALRSRVDLLCEAMVFLIERMTSPMSGQDRRLGATDERASLLERLKDG